MPNARNRKAMKKRREAERKAQEDAAKAAREAQQGSKNGDSTSSNVPEAPPLSLASEVLAKSDAELLAGKFEEKWVENSPFPHSVVEGFLDDSYRRLLKDELMHEEFYQKSNDLYDFSQTKELKQSKEPCLTRLKTMLQGPIRQRIQNISGISLSDNVEMFGAIYNKNCKLICHDDRMPRRRIAYILYLTPDDWSEADGGLLDLFAVDDKNREPSRVEKSILPKNNSFAFFEVSPKSFHQVSEVLSKKARVSISGWFFDSEPEHGNHTSEAKTVSTDETEKEAKNRIEETENSTVTEMVMGADTDTTTTTMQLFSPFTMDEDIKFEDWVGRIYRKKNMLNQVRKMFSDESSIELQDFLRKDIYKELTAALSHYLETNSGALQQTGPLHKQKFKSLALSEILREEKKEEKRSGKLEKKKDKSKVPEILRQFVKFFQSKAFADTVTALTGLDLTGKSQATFRRFCKGDYTLAHDEEPLMQMEGLDVCFCFTPGKSSWKIDWGGSVHYIDGEDELITVEPHSNTLSLVYRAEGGTSKFVKYVNSLAGDWERLDLSCTFAVAEDDDDDNDDDSDNNLDDGGDGDEIE
mmetsp:Transcript_24294/g.43085  ORF Transcript_24294/g.43085 Transcript_24294/m.43085 type:complete len:583 (+) Transcript_24294:184-1932(+)